MSEGKSWTPQQYEAIHAENESLLVSASAGTGKTEVLTERVLDMVVNRGFSLDRMIIVTFTIAAAEEMRQRITEKLREATELDPRLEKQLNMAPLAQISTIDALCRRIVSNHFEAADIDPGFGICQGTELEEIEKAAMQESMEEFYQQAAEDENVKALADKFSEEELCKAVQRLYNFLNSLPEPEKWLDSFTERNYSEENFWQEPFARALIAQARRKIEYAQSLNQRMIENCLNGEIDLRYEETITKDADLLKKLNHPDDEAFRLAVSNPPAFPRKVPIKKNEPPALGADEFDNIRDKYKKAVAAAKVYFGGSTERRAEDMNRMQGALRGLAWLVRRYKDKLAQKLEEQHASSFGNVQRLALAILRDEKLQADFASGYDAVFVDECQDVSPMQEELLRRLKRKGACSFWVGDVKQSIYRFRQADASLFLEKMKSYSRHSGASERLLFLSENFRSRSCIHRAVNRVFSHVFHPEVTELDYDADARLVARTESVGDAPVEIHILNSEEQKAAHESDAAMQMLWAALDIKRRVEAGERLPNRDGTPGEALKYGDILILTPVKSGVMDDMEQTLRQVGIPCVVQDGVNASDATELRTILSFLECLLDEGDDLALLASLRSPLLRFGERELADIRLCKPARDVPFRFALEEAAETAGEPLRSRCRSVLSLLNEERRLLRQSEVCHYIWGLLQRTGYYLYVSQQENGAQRRANLEYLCDRAADWDRNRADGMAGFVKAMRSAALDKDGANPAVNRPGDNAVHLMTIHKAKGLGARAVYVLMMNKALQKAGNDGSSTLSFQKNVGLSLQYRNEIARVKRDTTVHDAITALMRDADRAEKARLLYVAMTRPKEKLVLVGSMELAEDAEAICRKAWHEKDIAGVEQAGCYLDWLLQAMDYTDTQEEIWDEFSIFPQNASEEIHIESTDFPQKNGSFQYVFHMKPILPTQWLKMQGDSVVKTDKKAIRLFHIPEKQTEEEVRFVENPRNPLLSAEDGALHKIGVTALLQYEAEGILSPRGMEETPEETPEIKRLPLSPRKSSLLPGEATPPECLLSEEERAYSSANRGTLHHLVLELLNLEEAGEVAQNKDMPAFVRTQLRLMINRGQLRPEEAAQVNVSQVADFLCSPLGRRILNALLVRRETSFTLRDESLARTLVQGMIDLCFIENDGKPPAWVLVDFKTDRVDSGEELVRRYRRQVGYYRRALEEGTGYPVKEVYLYSLRLREAVAVVMEDEKSE